MTDIVFREKEFHLYLSGMGLFACYERFGTEKSLFELIEKTDKSSCEACIWMFCQFARQGELYRRFLGEDRGETPEFQMMLAAVQPFELPMIRAAVMACIAEGFGRENPGEEEDDPWLAEFEAKKLKKNTSQRRSISRRSHGVWDWLRGRA